MFKYTVSVTTGKQKFAETINDIYLTLVGTEGCSDRILLDKSRFARGSGRADSMQSSNGFFNKLIPFVRSYAINYNKMKQQPVVPVDVSVKKILGDIVLVKLEKEEKVLNDHWYCRCISVTTPSGDCVEFPCYRWIADDKEVVLRDGKGNIYIADYAILEGVQANDTDPDTKQYLAAPFCLLYKNSQNEILPIAIQLSRQTTAGVGNTVFLPSDNEYDWMLAKMWLLIPHIRFTIAINTAAREKLISTSGLFDKANNTGGIGIVEVIQKAMKTLTYKSLCFPEAMKARGVENKEDLPNYYYRDDGMMVWEAVKSFVSDVVRIYYGSDVAVQEDEEIQAFVQDLQHNMLQSTLDSTTGLPGFPNSPSTMRKPPPTQKGQVDMKYIMESLPDRGRCQLASRSSLGSQSVPGRRGVYPDVHFTEQPVKEAIKTFRKKLAEVTNIIKSRNEKLILPYWYLSPDRIPNSVAI
ncbi:Polyunsaturated fatty acid 5-lipoxygenase [Labeo rohita]|uniref:Polyunsaturated fatty acid 5-lipoxygenase n=1 Tax=Labeo rohita TaxID=84645 RepID=A0ABQ8L940_LABRO|nr:Polyunsaturated fatty acid 5-lipoxygenase [Labeo rohita]